MCVCRVRDESSRRVKRDTAVDLKLACFKPTGFDLSVFRSVGRETATESSEGGAREESKEPSKKALPKQ